MTPQLQQPLRSAWRTLPNHNIHKNAEEQHLLKLGVQQETTRNFAVGHNAGACGCHCEQAGDYRRSGLI